MSIQLLEHNFKYIQWKVINLSRTCYIWETARANCTNAAVRAKFHLYLLLVLSFVNPPSLFFPLPYPIDV